MITEFVFFGTVLLISFSTLVITIESILYLLRNSISFHIQHLIRRSIPFFSLVTVIISTVLRKTTNLVYKEINVPLINTISSGDMKIRSNDIRLVVITYLIITAILIFQYAVRYIICIINIKNGNDITYRFNHELGKRKIKVYMWKNANTPFCFGTLSKCIVFPENFSSGLDYAIKHEISHCDNCDSLTNNVARIMLLLMWFNPLAYIYYQQVKIGCEYACDERVTHGFSFSEKKEYIEVILASTQRKNFVFAGAALATEKTLKSRFKNVLSKPKNNSKISVIISVSVVLVLVTTIASITAIKIPDQRAKTVKINFSSEQAVNNEVYYEEYIDGKWFRGDLCFDSIEEIGYGIKSVQYVGTLYEDE